MKTLGIILSAWIEGMKGVFLLVVFFLSLIPKDEELEYDSAAYISEHHGEC